MSILIAIIVFGIVVLVHEFGHFIVARKCGILVEEFAIGMGPKVFGITKGDTLYSVRLFPIGGFCRMLGEDADLNDERAFNSKKVSRRIFVVTAGAAMNVLLSLLIFTGFVFYTGFSEPVVYSVNPNSPAEAAGLVVGDRITHVNRTKVNLNEDLYFALQGSEGKPVELTIARGSEKISETITPYKNEDGEFKIGFAMERKRGIFEKKSEETATLQRAGIVESFKVGFYTISYYLKMTVQGVRDLLTFKVKMSDDGVAGAIGIVAVISKVYTEQPSAGFMFTFLFILNFVALLSANLGVINLLPLPALDGGRLIFLLVEAVRRKPVPPEKEGFVHFVGFVLLMVLAAYVAYNDILKIIHPAL